MSLRDRIVEIVASRHGSGDIADAILADPEIAALREVAEATRRWCDEDVADLALAQVEIARLRAEVERLTRDRDLAERKAAVCREDVEINARRAESAEARVAELEAAAWELFQAFDGTDVALQARMLDNLRALLAPREPKSCGECGGSGYVWDGPAGVHISDGNAMKPCPECRGGEDGR